MRQELSGYWKCPSCLRELDAEECDEVRHSATQYGPSLIDFKCEDCGAHLIADTTINSSSHLEITKV